MILEKNDPMLNYTHCELIHQCFRLCFFSPFPESNLAPELHAAKHTKKALSTFSTAFNYRFEPGGYIINYPEDL